MYVYRRRWKKTKNLLYVIGITIDVFIEMFDWIESVIYVRFAFQSFIPTWANVILILALIASFFFMFYHVLHYLHEMIGEPFERMVTYLIRNREGQRTLEFIKEHFARKETYSMFVQDLFIRAFIMYFGTKSCQIAFAESGFNEARTIRLLGVLLAASSLASILVKNFRIETEERLKVRKKEAISSREIDWSRQERIIIPGMIETSPAETMAVRNRRSEETDNETIPLEVMPKDHNNSSTEKRNGSTKNSHNVNVTDSIMPRVTRTLRPAPSYLEPKPSLTDTAGVQISWKAFENLIRCIILIAAAYVNSVFLYKTWSVLQGGVTGNVEVQYQIKYYFSYANSNGNYCLSGGLNDPDRFRIYDVESGEQLKEGYKQNVTQNCYEKLDFDFLNSLESIAGNSIIESTFLPFCLIEFISQLRFTGVDYEHAYTLQIHSDSIDNEKLSKQIKISKSDNGLEDGIYFPLSWTPGLLTKIFPGSNGECKALNTTNPNMANFGPYGNNTICEMKQFSSSYCKTNAKIETKVINYVVINPIITLKCGTGEIQKKPRIKYEYSESDLTSSVFAKPYSGN